MTARPFALDEFAGAGGASLGLYAAGYDVLGLDYWPTAVQTHAANGIAAIQADLSVPPDVTVPPAGVSLLWASPPCQPYSLAGKQDGVADERDGVPWWLRDVAEYDPAVTIMENVATVAETFPGVLEAVLARLVELGYVAEARILNAADYGVPQTRRRLIVVARRDGRPIRWPEATHAAGDSMFHRPYVTMATALDLPPGWKLNRRQTDVPLVDADTRPAPTVTGASSGKSVWRWETPDGPQPFTNEHAATLQGFPAGYVWHGSRRDIGLQIGNAVPPLLAQRLAEATK